MKFNRLGHLTLLLGTTTAIVLGSAITVQAADASAAPTESARTVATDRVITADAMQVRQAAQQLNHLTQSSAATWLDYDRQWNEIKPSVEDMQSKLDHLEATAAHSNFNEEKRLVGEISGCTHELYQLLNQPGVQTTNPKFADYARTLSREAQNLAHIAKAS